MIKFAFAGMVAMGAATGALAQMTDVPAADTSAPAAATSIDGSNWTGVYGGVHAGYGFDNGRKIAVNGSSAGAAAAIANGVRPGQLSQNRAGWLGGGQLGINFQHDKLVFGAEGDFSYMHSRGTADYTGAGSGLIAPGRRTLVNSRLDWLGSARARLGYAPTDQGLIYVTGGYAFGKVKGDAQFYDNNSALTFAGGHNYTAQGWIAGAGGEFRPFSNGTLSKVSLGIEATYYDLGKSNIIAQQVSGGPDYYQLGKATRGYNGVVKINYHF